jgi:hypothetical protein
MSHVAHKASGHHLYHGPSDKLPWFATDFILKISSQQHLGVDKHMTNLPRISSKPLYKHLCSEFLLQFGENNGRDLVMVLASIQKT